MEKLGLKPSFWRGKRVFLTGHTGFKGSWLSLLLHHLGAEITGYSLPPPTQPNLFELAQVASCLVKSHRADIRDLESLTFAMVSAQPEIVFHLAAQPLVKTAHADPLNTFLSNITGTVHLFEAMRKIPGIQAALVITSDKVYLPHDHHAHIESDPLGGFEPYAASKACAEIITQAYRSTYFSNPTSPQIATARAGNVLGGGDWSAHRLVPDLVQAFCEGRKIPLRYPTAIRPWQYVLDPLYGYLLLAQSLCLGGSIYAQAWNFGPAPEAERTVGEVAALSASLWGHGADWIQEPGEHASETVYLRLNSDHARKNLQWQPQMCFEDTLTWTMQWYKAWQQGEDMAEFTQHQLSAYLHKYCVRGCAL